MKAPKGRHPIFAIDALLPELVVLADLDTTARTIRAYTTNVDEKNLNHPPWSIQEFWS